ncbi:MAG: TolB-like translocation protein [Minisyncoccota bacterium]
MKKNLLILLGVITLLAVAIGIYFYIHRPQKGNSPLSAFGGSSGYPTNTTQPGQSTTNNNASSTIALSAVRLLHQNPVSGFGVTTNSAGMVTVRYQERSLGHIFETTLPDGSETEVSKTTQPTVYESYWGKEATYALTRSMDQRGTLTASILNVGSEQTTSFSDTPTSVSVSPDASHFFYTVTSPQGTQGYSIVADGTTKKQLFSSPLSEWNTSWTNPSFITIATKPSAFAENSLYALDARIGALKPLLTNLPGLTGILSPDGKTLLYSIGVGGGIRTGYQDVSKGTSSPAPFTTIPDKCVWSTYETGAVFCAIPNTIPQGNYPDDWYRGDVSFSDSIWKFNVKDGMGVGRLLVDKIPNEPMDATSLTLSSKNDSYLFFINKKDGSLWSIDVQSSATSSIENGE